MDNEEKLYNSIQNIKKRDSLKGLIHHFAKRCVKTAEINVFHRKIFCISLEFLLDFFIAHINAFQIALNRVLSINDRIFTIYRITIYFGKNSIFYLKLAYKSHMHFSYVCF